MTALTATPQNTTVPPSMLLQVTGAPNPPATAYSSNFTAGVDGWTNAGSVTLTGNQTVTGTSVKGLRIQGPTTLADGTAQRALTGVVVGPKYRYKATFSIARGEVKLVAKDTASGTVLGQTAFVTYANPTNKTVTLSVDFTPTASTVTIQVVVHQTSAFGGSTADVYAYNVTVTPLGTWQGTTIYRTDANGVSVPVREDPAGQDTAGGTMTVTDYEAALVGPVTYKVVDGNGGTATVVTSHAEARRNLSISPRASAGGWLSNDVAKWTNALNEPVLAAHPLGITTACKVTTTATAGATLASTYNLDNLANSATVRGAGVWVYAPVPAAVTMYMTAAPAATTKVTNIPANVWTYCTTAGAASGYDVVAVTRAAGAAVAGEVTYLTGSIVETGKVPTTYFDGDTADDGATMHAWTGTPGASVSIETAEDPDLGAWLTLPVTADPKTPNPPRCVQVPLATDYQAANETTGTMHQVIGRSDKIGNPGPLSTRSGSLTVWQPDYAGGKALRDLLAGGAVAMFRQPSHPGMDAYLLPTTVREAPQSEDTTPRRWGTVVEFEEVTAP